VDVAGRADSEYPEPWRCPRLAESAAQLGNQFARRVDDELFIFFADVTLGAFLNTQDHRRDKNVIEGLL
jgi:hypothetical protein